MKNTLALGVDIGGSHITAALIDLNDRMLVAGTIKRKDVNSVQAADVILESWCGLMNEVLRDIPAKERLVAIAMPGPFDYENGISLIKDQEKFRNLYLHNVKAEIATHLNIAEEQISFINDAAGFLQGEIFSGTADGKQDIIGLTLGTGLGAARSIAGIATDAALWNTPFKTGIAEDYLSTRWFEARYEALSGRKIKGVKALNSAAHPDQFAGQIFQEFGENLAEFLVPLIRKWEPEAVILGGNIANAYKRFVPYLEAVLNSHGLHTEVLPARLKEDASLIGAASCWEMKPKHKL